MSIGFLAVLAIATTALVSPAAHAQTSAERSGLTVVLPDDFPPYISFAEDGSAEGERAEMWRLWSQKTGIAVTLVQKPWPQVLDTLARKEADVADMVGVTPERLLRLDFGPSYARADVALFVRRDIAGVRNLASAKGQIVGALDNSQCKAALERAGIQARGFGSMHDLIYTAFIGELPVFCLQTTPANFLLWQSGAQDNYRQTEPILTNAMHWTVRKGDTELFNLVDEGFSRITPTEAASIAARWSGQTLPGIFGFHLDQIIRLLEVIAAISVAAIITALVLRWRLGKALAAGKVVEAQLRQRIREQSCLHDVFLATDDMLRPTPDILRDVASALHKGWPGSQPPLVRIELMGHVYDEIGSRDATQAVSAPIMLENRERGRICLLATSGTPMDGGCSLILGLAASRVAGRALGATTLAMLQKSEERFRRTFQHSAQATAIIQDGRFVDANQAALDLLGYTDGNTFVGMTPAELSPPFQPDGEYSDPKARQKIDELLAKGSSSFEWEHLRQNGETVLVEVLLTAVTEDGRTDIFVLWNDITVKRQAEAALAAYQQTLEAQVAKRTQELTTLYDELAAIFTTATSGIALVRDSTIITCNPSLASILLWPHGDLIGAGTPQLYKDAAAWQDARNAAYESMVRGGVYETTTELMRLDGSSVWVRMRASAIDALDPLKGSVWVLEDISNEHAAQTQLAEARDLAVQAAQLKSDFLAHISHELRSPINAVLGFSELLVASDMADHQRDYVHKVQAAGRHLLLVINDVLDLSKVEAGKLRIEQSEFPLRSVLRNAVDTITKSVAEKNVELVVDVDPAVPQRLIGDPLRISQILMNYLTNAIKFTPSGTITLSVRPEPADGPQPPLRLRFSVSDTGVGMSPEQLARMFQSFSQAEDSTARLYGGTGLGLSICRQLAVLMQGEVGVESVPDKGTTIWAILPLSPAESHAAPAAPDRRLSDRHVLLIDDHPAARSLTAAALRSAGATVTAAASGAEALALIDQRATDDQASLPDVVITDLKMPDMNGVATLAALRARLGTKMPRTLLMTKQGGQEMVDLTIAEGIDDLLMKPVDPDLLVTKTAQLLAPVRALPATARPRSRARGGAGTPKPPAPDLPLSSKRALVVDDNPLNRELAAALLAKQGITVETAENGADGLERLLDRAFDIVFIDHQMPIMGGVETTRRIRALPTDKGRIPIIGLTGRASEADRTEALDAGMNDYLIKPVTPIALQSVLVRWLTLDMSKTPR